MSGDVLSVNLPAQDNIDDVIGEQLLERASGKANIDARRRLEERLEELRLQKDLKEFDFEF